MDESEAKNYIFLIWNDRLTRTSLLLVVLFSLFLTISLSFISGVIVTLSYIFGFLVIEAVFRRRTEAPNLLSLIIGKQRNSTYVPPPKPCSICNDSKCNRHRPDGHSFQPWQGLHIPEEVDEAVEDFLNRTLTEFVYSWYNDVSYDEGFIQELRYSIRYASSVLLHRALQIDLAHLITSKLIPAGLNHADDYVGSLKLAARQKVTLEKSTIIYLGHKLHIAAKNRKLELSYLRHLTTVLLPHLLPSSQLQCKNYNVLIREVLAGWVLLPLMDILADPAIINTLILLLLDKTPLTDYPNEPPRMVEFLSRFVSSVSSSPASALRLDLSSVLKDQKLLYSFMQYLKSERSVNVLQFCLDVEEFNRKMLTPDLSSQDIDNLYREAWDLFSVYFSPESPDCIHFSPVIVEEMRTILKESPENVVKLRTTPPLFQAYEYAYGILENTLCPLFHQSDSYFHLLCGPRVPAGHQKTPNRALRKWNDGGGAVARISNRLNKIKGALRSQPVEGHTFDPDSTLDIGETEFAEDINLPESSSCRDLNAWRVSIPSIEHKGEVNNKYYPVFNINVQRIDVNSDDDPDLYHWTVDRKYNDFYVLENKLTEFHGEFSDIRLPPKKLLFEPKGVELEKKREIFEDFLQRLLIKPNLRGSDLLHTFLRSPGEFVPSTSLVGAVPENLGRMIRRTVPPIRLRKERGQHLDAFLTTFITSTENSKTRSSKIEYKDFNVESERRIRCLTKTVFKDNFGISHELNVPVIPNLNAGSSRVAVQGAFDCLLYLFVRVFGAPHFAVQLALSIRTVFRNTLDALVDYYLHKKLRKLLVAPRLAHLIRLLQTAVFSPRSSIPTQIELEARAGQALDRLQSLMPSLLHRWVGAGYKAGLLTLFTAIQNPPLNKQLVYTLLDTVAVELYPDLALGEISPQPTEK